MDPTIITSLVKIIEVKDLSTAAHTWRVALYARAMAEHAGLDHVLTHRITQAAALHDLGKIDIPDAILQKAGPLTPDEFAIIQQHPALGHERLVSMGETDEITLELVRHHHERPDGLGYPDGLVGDAIALAARIFAVIDSFDAMTSVRPYRQQVGAAAALRALDELRAGAGTRYDARAVELFVSLFASGSLDWILHYFNDECPVPAYCPNTALAASPLKIVVNPVAAMAP